MITLGRFFVGTIIFFLSWLFIWVLFAGVYWLATPAISYVQAFHSPDIASWTVIIGFVFSVIAVVCYGIDVSDDV